jgi:putative transposon-encoded protein
MKEALALGKEVETFYEKKITKFGNPAKLDAPKVYIGWRAYVAISKNQSFAPKPDEGLVALSFATS